MNVFNRLVIVVLVLVIVVLTAVLVIVPKQTFELTGRFSDFLALNTDAYLQNNWAFFAGGRVLVGGAIIVVCLFVLWLELRRPRKKAVRAQKLAGGEAHIVTDSIEERLAYNIDQLPDVVKVTPRVTGRSRGIDVDLFLETAPDIDVPMKTEEVMQVTREVVVERMGLKLGKVKVKIKHAPYPRE